MDFDAEINCAGDDYKDRLNDILERKSQNSRIFPRIIIREATIRVVNIVLLILLIFILIFYLFEYSPYKDPIFKFFNYIKLSYTSTIFISGLGLISFAGIAVLIRSKTEKIVVKKRLIAFTILVIFWLISLIFKSASEEKYQINVLLGSVISKDGRLNKKRIDQFSKQLNKVFNNYSTTNKHSILVLSKDVRYEAGFSSLFNANSASTIFGEIKRNDYYVGVSLSGSFNSQLHGEVRLRQFSGGVEQPEKTIEASHRSYRVLAVNLANEISSLMGFKTGTGLEGLTMSEAAFREIDDLVAGYRLDTDDNIRKMYAKVSDAVRKSPDEPSLLYAKAVTGIYLGQLSQSSDDFAAVERLSPDHRHYINSQRARHAYYSGDFEYARILMNKTLRNFEAEYADLEDKDGEQGTTLYHTILNSKRFLAIMSWRAAQMRAHTVPIQQFGRNSYLKEIEFSEALFREIIDSDGENRIPAVYYNLAQLLRYTGSEENLDGLYKRSLNLVGKRVRHIFARDFAMYLEERGRIDDAIDVLRNTLSNQNAETKDSEITPYLIDIQYGGEVYKITEDYFHSNAKALLDLMFLELYKSAATMTQEQVSVLTVGMQDANAAIVASGIFSPETRQAMLERIAEAKLVSGDLDGAVTVAQQAAILENHSSGPRSSFLSATWRYVLGLSLKNLGGTETKRAEAYLDDAKLLSIPSSRIFNLVEQAADVQSQK